MLENKYLVLLLRLQVKASLALSLPWISFRIGDEAWLWGHGL